MSNGLGETFRRGVLDYILRAGTAPGRVATYFVSLHTADPGVDGQTAGEVTTGVSYARQSITSSGGWTLPSAATPYTISNAAIITFPTAGSNWGSGSPITYFGIWNNVSAGAASNFVARGLLNVPQTVNTGNTASFAIAALTVSITTVTATNNTGMLQTFRKDLYTYLLGAGTGGTDPFATLGATTLRVSLHTADPGVDALTGNEATGSGYARATINRSSSQQFGVSSTATPNVSTNSAGAVAFPAATGDWSTGSAFTYFTIWKTTSSNAGEAVIKGTITSQTVLNGNTASFAASTLSTQMEVTP